MDLIERGRDFPRKSAQVSLRKKMDETGLTASTRRFMERRDGSSHGSISRGNDFTEGRGGGWWKK